MCVFNMIQSSGFVSGSGAVRGGISYGPYLGKLEHTRAKRPNPGGPQTSDSSGPFHEKFDPGEVGGVGGRGVGTGILSFGGQCVL